MKRYYDNIKEISIEIALFSLFLYCFNSLGENHMILILPDVS